jgi:hypothetical protein
MHRLFLGVALAFLASTVVLTGCGQSPHSSAGPATADDSSPAGDKPISTAPAADPFGPASLDVKTDPDTLPVLPTLTPPTGPEKYEAAIGKAFLLMAEKKDAEALAALREAQSAQQTDFVKTEIARLEARITRAEAAQKAADDIKVVLEAGQGEQASKLAAAALSQFGDTDLADNFTTLKRQADALLVVQAGPGGKQKLMDEAEAARKENNLRAALVAYEQSVAAGTDPGPLKDTYEGLRTKLAGYDDNRAKAAELRKDPYMLEQAVTVLKTAAESWDTPQVKQEISECEVAIQNRRDRVAIADFEVIEDIGVPRAGHAIAEELVAAMRPRFDVVERSQSRALLDEMKIDDTILASNDTVRAEFGKLAKARYVVLGSVNRLGGINVNARLVDTQTGLVVQTARVAAATPEDLTNRLPALGRMLQMTDAEKRAYEAQLAEKARPVEPAPTSAELPPPPPPPTQAAAAPPPAPIVTSTPRPPAYGEVVAADYGSLKVIEVGAAPPPVVIVEAPQPVQQRAFFAAVEIGDNCYRRGDFRMALKHFEFALTLNPGNADLRLRLAQCRPLCPPPVEVVVVTRPRMVVLPVAEFRTQVPSAIDPGLGLWTVGALSPYLSSRYELVDANEAYWWMCRLGLTIRDVLVNPAARLCLGRALGARYFLMGSLQDNAGIDVTARVIDGELNGQVYGAMMHVNSSAELRYRMPELAAGMFAPPPPAQTIVVIQQPPVLQQQLVAAQVEYRKGNFSVAFGMYQQISTAYPTCYEARSLTIELDFRSRRSGVEAAQVAMWQQQQAAFQAQREQQIALAAAAEGARQQARRDMEFMEQARKAELWKQQVLAQQALVAQAQAMQAQNMAAQRAAILQAAANIQRNEQIQQQLIQARAAAAVQQQQQVRQAVIAQADAVHAQQMAQLNQIHANIAASVAQQQRDMQAKHQQIVTHVNAEYDQFVAFGKQAEAKGNYPAAVTGYQSAKRLKPSPEIELMIGAAINKQALAQAALKGEVEKKKVEGAIANEMIKNKEVETAIAAKKAQYDAQYKLAQQKMAIKEYEQAAKAYREAAAYVQTQEALAGIKAAEAELNRAKVAADVAEQKRKADQKRLGTAAEKLAAGRSAIAAGDIPKALAALRSAKALKPGDLEIEKSLAEAEALQQRGLTAAASKEPTNTAPKKGPAPTTGGKADALVAKARAAITAKDMGTAYQAIVEASKLDPRDPDVQKVRLEYEAARTELTASKTDTEATKKQAQYESAMSAAQAAMTAKKYDDAVAKATDALRIKPGDAAATSLMNQAKRADAAADAAATEATKKDAAYRQNLQDATAALSARKYDVAIREAKEALTVKPGDPAATRILTDAQNAKAAGTAAAEADTHQEAYAQAMQAGRTAYGARKFDEALAHFEAALKAKPGDSIATQSIAVVKKAIANTSAAAEPKKDNPATAGTTPAVDPKRKELYDAWLAHADKLMAAKKYEEAAEAYGNALKAVPNDPAALKGQAAAKTALAGTEPVPPKKDPVQPVVPKKDPVIPKADPTAARVAALMKEAADDERAGRYGEARTGYQEVLKLAPTNAEARKHASFCHWMDQGKSQLAAGKAADAAASFRQALRIDPNDANAKQLLQQAQQSQPAPPKPKKK